MSKEIIYKYLLYSKYSRSCKLLLDLFEKNNIHPENSIELMMVSIDNENFKAEIIKNKTILNISVVPCILVIYKDGYVEKFDGIHAYNWVEKSIGNLIPPKIKIEMSEPQIQSKPVEQPQPTPLEQPTQESIIKDITTDNDRNTNPPNIPKIISNPGNYIPVEEAKTIIPPNDNIITKEAPASTTRPGNKNIMDIYAQMQKERTEIEKIKPSGPIVENRP